MKKEVDFLKIDIEGLEERVIFELAQKNRLDIVREMCIEYHRVIWGVKRDINNFLNFLGKNNFACVVQDNNESNSLIHVIKTGIK